MRLGQAGNVDVRVHRGSRYSVYLRLKDAAGGPLDLTSYMPVKMKVAHKWTDEFSFLEIEASLVCLPEDGEVVFEILPEHTEDLPVKGYDMTIVADEYTVLHGRFGVLPRNRPVQEVL